MSLISKDTKRKVTVCSAGLLTIPMDQSLHAALDRIALKWGCGMDVAARRVIVLALTGWRLRHEATLVRLSRYVRTGSDPFRKACTLLRSFATEETAAGEILSEEDLDARLGVILDELLQREAAGEKPDLVELLSSEKPLVNWGP